MNLQELEQLHNICIAISELKSQQIGDLPHYANQALYFQNDEISSGILNNKTEIKIHLLTGHLLYFSNETGYAIDLIRDDIEDKLSKITEKLKLKMPQVSLQNVTHKQLSEFYSFAIKAKRTIELFRMTLEGHFTQANLWPDDLDFSVEWFTGKRNEQIGTGISPGDKQLQDPFLYMIPYPFNPKMTEHSLPIGKWYTSSWKGILVERDDLGKYAQNEVNDLLHQLFLISKKNFD